MRLAIVVEDVFRRVERLYGVRRSELLGPDRSHTFARARRAACLVFRKVYGMSYTEIGTALGFDYQVARHYLEHAKRELEDPFFAEQVAALVVATQRGALLRVEGPPPGNDSVEGEGKVLRLRAK